MKITLDLTSVVVGGAVALALGVVAGFSPQATQLAPQRPAAAVPLKGALRPLANDSFFMLGNEPAYTVPSGRVLLIQTLSTTGSSNVPRARLSLNGTVISSRFYGDNGSPYRYEFHAAGIGGILVPEGSTISLVESGGGPASSSDWIAGYLEDV